MTLAEQIERALEPKGTPARAVQAKRYLKSELSHFGVTVPVMRSTVLAIVRGVALTRKELLAAVDALWKRGVYELRAAAVELLTKRADLLTSNDSKLIERLIREAKTWALVDVLSTHVMGQLIAADGALAKVLDRWARDDDFWLRRAAMLSLLVPLREGGGDFARFCRYADAMLEERELFIRKAIGWILRETSRKTPDRVYAWLLPRAHRASGLTIREATKYLSKSQVAAIKSRMD